MENTINHLRYEAYYRKISLLIEGNLTQEQLHGIEWFKLQLPHLSVFSYNSMQTRIATKSHNLSVWTQIFKQKDSLSFVMTHLGDRKDFNKTMWAKPFLNYFI